MRECARKIDWKISKSENSLLDLEVFGSGMRGRRRKDKDWSWFGRLCHVALWKEWDCRFFPTKERSLAKSRR